MRGRAPLALSAALIAALAVGCLDAISPASSVARTATVQLSPVFAGADGGIPGDVDLIRLILTDPPSAPDTFTFSIAPGQDTIRLSASISLNRTVDTVDVRFEAIRSSDNTVLYTGARNVAVTSGSTSAPAPVVATYVGPGQSLLSIAITPTALALKPGDTASFGVVATDSSDATIVGMPVLFASRNTAVVTVSAAGVAKALAVGTAWVVASAGARTSVKDSAQVTVSTSGPAIASLAVQPGYAVLGLGGTASLTVTAKDANGNPVSAGGVTYASRSPGIVSVGASGTVTALGAGTAVIVASAGSVADSMLVAAPAAGSAVVTALAATAYHDVVKAGDTVKVLVMADLRAVPAEVLGSYNAQLVWNPATLQYVRSDTLPGSLAGGPTINAGQAATGTLRFGAADPNGLGGQVTLLEVVFTAAASGTTTAALSLTDLSAAKTFTNLLPAAALVSGVVTVR